MAHLMSIPLVTRCSLPSYSSHRLGWYIHMSPALPLLKSKFEVPRLFGDEISCVSTVRASTPNVSEFSLTAPSLELVGRMLERREIMSIASADVADQTSSLQGADNTGTKFFSTQSLKRRDTGGSLEKVETDGAEVGKLSIWDALNRAFEKPSIRTTTVIEESGNPGSPLATKVGADPVQFLIVSVALIFIWWLGNYYVPDLVFRNTVFRDQSKDNPLSGDTSTTAAGAEMPTTTGFAQTQDRSRKKARKTKRN